MQQYAAWKYVALVLALLFGALYAAPNLFGDDPSVQIARESGEPLEDAFGERVAQVLAAENLAPKASARDSGRWLVRLDDPAAQLRAADALKRGLGRGFVVALNQSPRTPAWLAGLGAKPMALGLDLRGGVHLLIQVDVEDVRERRMTGYLNDLPAMLRKEGIRYTTRRQSGDAVVLEFADGETLAQARELLTKEEPGLALTVPDNAQPPLIEARLSEQAQKDITDNAVKQNLTTLRSRMNQLGVAEPIVQRQGKDRIVVQVPGVRDSTQIIDVLGATATLEYRAVDQDNDPEQAAASGIVPAGSELFFERADRRPVLLKRELIVSGDQLIDAAATVDPESNTPAVSVTLDGPGAKRMFAFTEKNVGNPMAVLFKETVYETSYNAQGEAMREKRNVEEVISIATVRGIFGKRFQTTGLTSKEAKELSILLRGGALAAPIDIVEERTVGPSLGADNIRQGFAAAALGLGLVVVFMVFYYRVFGLFAVAALLTNLLIVVAVLSILQATLTMPGIAGIVLHMGIAVDANVLIYERIREELRNGMAPHAAIQAGYDRAFLTIADANVTVLIGTLVLFALGAGPVKGFAITLAIGIISSQFTAIVGSRALAQLVFARRKLKELPIW